MSLPGWHDPVEDGRRLEGSTHVRSAVGGADMSGRGPWSIRKSLIAISDLVAGLASAPKHSSGPDPAKAAAHLVAGAIDTGWMVGVSIDRVLGKELADGHK